MKKVIMNLEDYKGKYAMHCPTEESAELFCEFLNENDIRLDNGNRYYKNYHWDIYRENTAYVFNEGVLGNIFCLNYTILEIDDFIQEVQDEL